MATQTNGTKRQKKADLLHDFKKLNVRKKILENELESIAEQIAAVKAKLMGKFEEEGVHSAKLETGELIYIHAQYWAKPLEGFNRDDIMKALRAVGLDHLIKEDYNSNSLSAIIREMKKNKEEIPEELTTVLMIDPTYDVRIRGLKV